MPDYLTREDLNQLLAWPTPAISNAIELFNIKPRNEGFMLPEIQCRYPAMQPMIGYAVTAVITADSPEGPRVSPPDWWNEIQKYPEPRIAVLHDIDHPVIGSFWGEVNGNIHKALGCVGTVTDGSVRDLDEVEAIGFHFFSSCVTVSHAYVHMIDFGAPVKVGGLLVKPGDLIMGDKHGVISIPPEIARDIPKAAQMVEDWERKVINFCKSENFAVEGLRERFMSARPSWPSKQQ
ncbi:MAG: RraA family protein [Deltaproteobacteria bacterium]|jgi:regulator of RNase E activity RraA|nr:RraA family protein [Deltaproteobacteria bacterium]